MTATIRAYHVPVGIYCVPAAICALTGADLESVVLPALNRAQKANWLLGPVGGVYMDDTYTAIDLMGWVARKHKDVGRHKLFTWAKLSADKYVNKRLLVTVKGHALALINGLIYDTFTPFGCEPDKHACSGEIVRTVAMLQPKETK